jgi:hypothetical protein
MLAFLRRTITPYFESNGPPAGAPPANPPAPAAPPGPPAAQPAPVVPPAAPPAEPPKTFDEEYVKGLRKEAADYRTKATAATKANEETLRLIATQLGIELPGGIADPKAIADELAKTKRENLELKVGSALEQASRKHGADTELLIPVLRGSAQLEKLDPSSENFTKDVSDLVKTMLERNPKLRASQVPSRSGGEFPGGTPPVQQLTRDQLKGMSPDQIMAARAAGQLDQMMGKTGA